MRISPGRSKSSAAVAANEASGAPTFFRILHRKVFSCGVALAALLAGVTFITPVVAAQEERPQITPGERKVPRKKDAGPRALGVLQVAENNKATLVPIAILINGKFWDAAAYKADPIPMALEYGTVYEAERTGSSLGLFTVNGALHSNAVNTQAPWLGTGAWRPAGTEEASTAQKAEATPVGIDTSDQPPRLTHDANTAKNAPPASGTPPSTGKPSDTTPPSTKSGGTSDSGDGPPRLSKPPASSPTPDSSAPAPGDSKTNESKSDDRAKVPASDSGASETNRPRLRRGKAAGSFADEEVPGYSKPGVTPPPAPANGAKIVEIAPAKGAVQLIPAISDANGPDPRSFTFEWIKGEDEARRKQMTAMAKDQIRAYVDAAGKAKITPLPARPAATRHVAATKAREAILENIQMGAYDLWNSNQPVLVYTAEAHMPPPPAGVPHSQTDAELQYSILLVAYPDIYNNLHKLYAAVTDKFHLDVTPRLELIDAVDADGDGRGELLFRVTSDAGSGWAIYRATPDKLWKMFDSLNPE